MSQFLPGSRTRHLTAAILPMLMVLLGSAVHAAPAHLSRIIPPPPGYYNAGDVIDVGLRFNAPLVVTGTPRIRMLADSQIVYASYHSGSGTDQLTFRYTVQPGHNAPSLSLVLVELNSGTILGPGGEPADISIIDDGFLTVIDTAAPAAASIRRHLPQVPNTTSGIVVFRVSFSEPVLTPPPAAFQLVRSSGLAGGTLDSIRGSGTEWYVTIAGLTGYGLLRLDVVANSFSDHAGNPVTAFSAGETFGRLAASLVAWGDNSFHQIDGAAASSHTAPMVPPAGAIGNQLVAVAATGRVHSLVLTREGSIFGWGNNTGGQLGITTALMFSSSSSRVLMNGALAGQSIVGLGAGNSWSGALSADGSLFTWGNNSTGQLGKGTIDPGMDGVPANRVPGPVLTTGVLSHAAVISISAGSDAWHSLALVHPRANVTGMVVPGSGTYPADAALTFHLSFSETVTVTGSPSLALDQGFGRIGYASYLSSSGSSLLTFRYLVQPGDYAPDGLSPYFTHHLGVVDRYGLGVDHALPPSVDLSRIRLDGRPPIPLEISRSQPVAVPEGAAITTAGSLMFRLTFDKPVTGVDPSDFTVVTTGSATGQVSKVLGTGDIRYAVVTGVTGAGAVRIDLKATGTGITDVMGNPLGGGLINGQAYYHVAASALYGWGDNTVGQAGPNSISGVPAVIPSTHALQGRVVAAVAAGLTHSLALCDDGTLAAWGGNSNGQLGCAHPDASSPVPVAVTMHGALQGKTVIAIAAGADHCLALTADGLVFAWGRGDQGQLGTSSGTDDRDQSNVHSPAGISLANAIPNYHARAVAIAAGESHSVVLDIAGGLFTWGANDRRQLGDGSAANRSRVPVAVAVNAFDPADPLLAIAAGSKHTVVRTEGGKLFGWGDNLLSQLGSGLSDPVAIPGRISGGDLATAHVAALSPGCCAGHNLVMINAAGNPLTLIERWRLRYFGSAFATSDTADAADYDKDGRHNLIEYATATNPLNPDPGSPASLSLSGSGRNTRLALTFHRILDESLAYTVEASTALAPGSWTPINPPVSPATGPVTVVDTGIMSAYSRRFLRLRVTRTP
jgi:alpha-tubulin suppressor-like RCC1 family protein